MPKANGPIEPNVNTRRADVNQFLRWGVLATALIVLAGSTAPLHAQGQQPSGTKVGVVNMGLIFTKYRKAEIFKKEMENELNPLKIESEKIKDVVEKHVKWLKQFGGQDTTGQREKSEKAVKDGQRALEDLDMAARKLIGKKQETNLIQLYKEIHGAVQVHAQQSGYHIIVAYADGPPEQDQFTIQNINRKMTGLDMGAGIPFYWHNGLDISNDVLARLNAPYPPTVGATPAGFTAPPKQ